MSLYNNCFGTTSGCALQITCFEVQPELIPDPLVDIACYSEPMDLGSDQRLQHLVQLLVKGSKEISLEFHSELIPDSKYLSECESNLLYSILESGISDLTVTVQGGYPTIINIGCYPLIPDSIAQMK